MCGIVACRRTGEGSALPFLLDGLVRLEYRGYDSAGIAVQDAGAAGIRVERQVGRVAGLCATLGSGGGELERLGIGHTRWATHGSVTTRNAHPHLDCSGRVALVHNGIIENADELRGELAGRGHAFRSEVDSEVVAHLIEEGLAEGQDGRAAVCSALRALEGSWALAVIIEGQDRVLLAANRSPLVLALTGEAQLAASDMTPLLPYADTVHVLDDGDLVELGAEAAWWSSEGEPKLPPPPVRSGWRIADVEQGQYDDFMDKEIAEQFELSRNATEALAEQIADGSLWRQLDLPPFERLRFLGCGTSLNAAAVTARVFRALGRFPTETVVASESQEFPLEAGTLSVAFSQSGETADVLSALAGAVGPVLALTNAPYSSLARRADALLDIHAGPEIGVAATKTFTAQVLSGVAFALAALRESGRLDPAELALQLELFRAVPEALSAAHLLAAPLADALADDLAEAPGFMFVSRGPGLPYASEGALKLKEITYRWAEAYAAGELKHGPIALLEAGVPVVVIEAGPQRKLDANIAEMEARGARIIRIAAGEDAHFPVLSPVEQAWGPIESVLPLQHLARSLAVRLGRDADKPRNLAKSVTVD